MTETDGPDITASFRRADALLKAEVACLADDLKAYSPEMTELCHALIQLQLAIVHNAGKQWMELLFVLREHREEAP